MRRLVALVVGPALAVSLALQPVLANHNEAVGWVDFYRGATLSISFHGTDACDGTSCSVSVALSKSYFQKAAQWGCTSATYTIPANTVYSSQDWRTLAGRCADPKGSGSYILFFVRIDALVAGTTTWVTHDAPVTVRINVVLR